LNSDSNIVLQQVRVINPVGNIDQIVDILIAKQKIQTIIPHIDQLANNTTIINGQGLVIGPGLVDIYSHSGEPGHEDRESLISLTRAAIAGGFTHIAVLPNTVPYLDNPDVIISLKRKIQQIKINLTQASCISFWGAISRSGECKQMTELADLSREVIGFTGQYNLENLSLIRQVMEYVKFLNQPIALTFISNELKVNQVIREGAASIRYGLPGNPHFSEAIAIAALLEMIDAIRTPVHLMRVSTARGVELIAQAKQRGLPVTASTTWMHLLYNTNDLDNYDPNLRLEPSLGNENDMQALIEGVRQGVIDAIAIDHTPYTYEEKTVAFAEAPPGVIGLELALPILWQRFVSSGEWSALELWRALSTNPQLCLGEKPINLSPGQPAEMTLFDPNATWTVNKQNLQSQASNTPWWDKEISGRVVRIWSNQD
jgi:dihydroorotase